MKTKTFTSPGKKTKLVVPAMNTHVKPAFMRRQTAPLGMCMPASRRTPPMVRLSIILKDGGTVIGREWGPDNRFAHAPGWLYLVRYPDGRDAPIKEEDIGKLLPSPPIADGHLELANDGGVCPPR